MKEWFVYILRCADDSLYTGITTDLNRRVKEHNENNKSGSRYTRARRPVQLVYREMYNSRSDASKREAEIKQLSHYEKNILITNSH